jgi:hypothetical protein
VGYFWCWFWRSWLVWRCWVTSSRRYRRSYGRGRRYWSYPAGCGCRLSLRLWMLARCRLSGWGIVLILCWFARWEELLCPRLAADSVRQVIIWPALLPPYSSAWISWASYPKTVPLPWQVFNWLNFRVSCDGRLYCIGINYLKSQPEGKSIRRNGFLGGEDCSLERVWRRRETIYQNWKIRTIRLFRNRVDW